MNGFNTPACDTTHALLSLHERFRFDHSFNHSFIHPAVCLTTGPQTLPKRVLHTVRSSASSFNLKCLLFSLWLSSSCLHLLSRLPVTSILPSTFPQFDIGSIFLDTEDWSHDSNANCSRYEIPLPIWNCFVSLGLIKLLQYIIQFVVQPGISLSVTSHNC